MIRARGALGIAVLVAVASGWGTVVPVARANARGDARAEARGEARAEARAHVQQEPKLRLAIAGLTHDHVHGAFRRLDAGDITVVGIYEPNTALAERYAAQHRI